MANGRRLKRDDDSSNLSITPSEPVRRVLPRRCKGIQPFYGIDMDFEDDDIDDRLSARKRRGLGSSSSAKENITTEAQGQGQSGHFVGRTMTITNGRRETNEEALIPTILSWLMEMKVVREKEIIYCLNGTYNVVIGQGMLTREGILCFCCNSLFTVSSFHHHAGDLAENPYEKIFITGTRISLLACQIEAWNRHSVPARDGYHHVVRRPRVRDHHDDSCVICADGGDLMCCEKCPSTYHPKCMGFEDVPQDEWHCPYCHCKYCDRDDSVFLLLTCFQCLKKYHCGCSQQNDKILHPLPNIPFCGNSCWQLYRKLDAVVGRSFLMDSGFSWTIVRRMDISNIGENFQDLHLRATCNSTVALAAKLMEESFKLIVDRQTRTNMIQSVVYSCGSNFTRTNFSRFYTVVLEFQGQIISVASLRMPSPKLTEIPFIATAERWRNRGMCKLLLFCIESALTEIGVERTIIPSSEDMVSKWQEKFTFRPIDEPVKREIRTLNTLMFPRTTRLQKVIKKRVVNDLNLPPAEEHQFPLFMC